MSMEGKYFVLIYVTLLKISFQGYMWSWVLTVQATNICGHCVVVMVPLNCLNFSLLSWSCVSFCLFSFFTSCLLFLGIFSPAYKEQEVIVGELIKQNFPHVTYTLSYELGQLGLLERESATILNESLKRLCHRTLKGFKQELAKIGLTCPIYFTQNDGTLLRSAFA